MRVRGLSGILLLIAVLLFVLPSAASYYTDWLWFRELGYEGVFLRTLNAQTAVFAGTFVVVYLFLFLNLRFARRRTAERPRVVLGTGGDGRPIAFEGRQLASLAQPISAIAAMLFGLVGAANWLAWISFFRHVSFNVRDPLFGYDVAFYVFRLPIYQLVRQQAIVMSLIALVGCGIYYVFSGSFMVEARPGTSTWPRVRLIPSARRHLSLLTALVLGLLAWGAWLEVPSTLITPTDSSVAFGASYSDVYARIPFLWLTVATLAVGAGLSIWHGFGRRGWPLPLAIAMYVVVSAGGSVYTGFVQRLVVTPNEQDKERPYIEHNIQFTRLAYALDRVEERDSPGDASLSPHDVADNAGTIENVRLWDHAPLLQTFSQIQVIRNYYDFVNIDNDRYMIDGKYRQVMLSVRELNTSAMPNPSWVNERLSFTHGYGLTLGPVNQVTTEGLPVLFIRDLPPVSTVSLKLTRPSVYYGERSNEYALVKTWQPEFDYPKGEDNEKTFYNGSGGVPIGSFWRRLLFAMRFASTDILVTRQIRPESRILFHRNVVDRAAMLAPFLTLDGDPYPVVTAAGNIVWMQDAYTTSSSYPYATPYSGPLRAYTDVNYLRNSVKIVTDAYNGSVALYLADPDDPIAQTLNRIFPGLLRPLDEMPPDLRQHVRYPEDIFAIQARMYATYHMTNPQVFYNKEDQWSVPPLLDSPQSSKEMEPYYTIMKLPREKQTEFIQMLPFTPSKKSNLSAWLAARSDGAHYGHLLAYIFPKNSLVFGPQQIQARINQDQIISPQITLWSAQGSQVIWGQLLVIPIRDALLYVRPLYLRSPNDPPVPELKRVIVAYQNKIVMEETLTRALVSIFGSSVASALSPDQLSSSATSVIATPVDVDVPAVDEAAVPDDASTTALAAEAQTHLDNMDKAMRAGDWALYGEELKKLRAVIERMPKTK
jgi:uncharacterized membrane protein (UPF0182 family)